MKEFYKYHWITPDTDMDGVKVFTIKTLKDRQVGEIYDTYAEAIVAIDERADY